MVKYADLRVFFRSLTDLEFLSMLSDCDFYSRQITFKPFYWNNLIGNLKEITEGSIQFLVRRVKEISIWRLSLVSVESFRMYFIRRLHVGVENFETRFVTAFSHYFDTSNLPQDKNEEEDAQAVESAEEVVLQEEELQPVVQYGDSDNEASDLSARVSEFGDPIIDNELVGDYLVGDIHVSGATAHDIMSTDPGDWPLAYEDTL